MADLNERGAPAASATPFRLLVVSAEEMEGNEVRDAVADRIRGRETEVRLIAPALAKTGLENFLGDVDDARKEAEHRSHRAIGELETAGVEASGGVGDSDLRLAIQDELQVFDADEIVIVAHQGGGPYAERRGIEEAEHSFGRPIVEIFVQRHNGDVPQVAGVEELEAEPDQAPDPAEHETRSANFPPYRPREVVGIIIALLGTAFLWVLAGTGHLTREGTGSGGLGTDEAQLLIAGATTLINLAHVVGLMLFQAGPYRGPMRSFFASLSLYGTALAVAASLLLELL